ncbi:hypothetical protein [Rhodococcus sp. APC 3903]|uniref:hypothetical protein n=1 Tax=Rhodococcus sp. APC 3903 TaxID=3035193 RepID=UPI0025B42747|nr:hypothetical protein [Rhodococcus sp. APC 3903]MDN3460774.1 hypothetical protein [Rhodococcus sp. APC 3903]
MHRLHDRTGVPCPLDAVDRVSALPGYRVQIFVDALFVSLDALDPRCSASFHAMWWITESLHLP